MAHGTFQVGDLTAVIGDNEAHDQHAAGGCALSMMKVAL